MMQEILSKITWIEWLGVGFSVAQVLLARLNKPINYLFGIAGISLTLWVMFTAKLYAEFTLNIYYLVMSIYGWFFWKFGKQQHETPISASTKNDWTKVVGIVVVSFLIFYFALTHFTNSDVPLWDSLVSAFAWAGMWLMAKRKIENWILLNISNLISIPLMIHKDLYLYAVLSAFLFIVAVSAYFKWSKILKNSPHAVRE
ncbi:nicotinamide riboside transporter PnuC [Vaginella massiliensis]|uniref:nicotinamide riboside transporter PnuC n=1 Tax=Vaginella massiliensis TaxID=1816680 RepID=UPI00083888E1|nr:nicotinamide riboside transporter PnuC [Vaginella massiliensis]